MGKVMTDKELRALLLEIDVKFKEIEPLLWKAGDALVDKALHETGVKLDWQIGWEEAGMDCLCLMPDEESFRTKSEAEHWLETIYPLFRGLQYLYLDIPFRLS